MSANPVHLDRLPTQTMPGKTGRQRAGTLVYRFKDGALEFLTISSSSDPTRWVLPAGGVDRGETPRETARRETAEEAGLLVAIFEALGVYTHVKRRGVPRPTQVYLAEAFAQCELHEPRALKWWTVEDLLAGAAGLPDDLLNLVADAAATLASAAASR